MWRSLLTTFLLIFFRACWMLHYFADVKYKDPNVLGQSFKLTIDSLLKSDEEVPVKVTFLDLQFIFSEKLRVFFKKSAYLGLTEWNTTSNLELELIVMPCLGSFNNYVDRIVPFFGMMNSVSNFECLFWFFFQLTLKLDLKEVQFSQNYCSWVKASLWYLEGASNFKTWQLLKNIMITNIWNSTLNLSFDALSKLHDPGIRQNKVSKQQLYSNFILISGWSCHCFTNDAIKSRGKYKSIC